jgi:hypothetical protein
MWNIHFEGYFQCRLATDPDDTDERRGQNGWTFAYDGEPDLDRIIRFQNPTSPRSFAPVVGAAVIDVNGDKAHGLVGAQITLNEGAKFEGRNGLIAAPGKEPISPFVFEIRKDGFQLMRRDDYDVNDVNSRKPHMGHGVTQLSAAELAKLGLEDLTAYRNARRNQLEAAMKTATDPTALANLKARIEQLKSFNSANDIQVFSLQFKVAYAHQLRHAGTVMDPAGLLPGAGVSAPWEIAYWMGAWDADALQGFVEGSVSVTTVA